MSRIAIALSLIVGLFFSTSGQAKSNNTDVPWTELRSYNNLSYKVVDTDGFIIYSRDVHATGSKATVKERRYYFSKNGESEIHPLTINNLKYAFPRNREFHDLLDIHFRSNDELTRYDSFYKEFKLKSIFKKATI
jgi:hypothetical protein